MSAHDRAPPRFSASGILPKTIIAMLAGLLCWVPVRAHAASKTGKSALAVCSAPARHARRHLDCVVDTGTATWYGKGFHGHTTANGEVYNMNALTAAHASLPMNTLVRVTYLRTGRSVVVRINDRIPAFVDSVIDLSAKAAALLGMKRRGAGTVEIVYLAKGDI